MLALCVKRSAQQPYFRSSEDLMAESLFLLKVQEAEIERWKPERTLENQRKWDAKLCCIVQG